MTSPFLYQENNRYFAQVAGESEAIAAVELEDLGMLDVSVAHRGVWFSGDFSQLMRANYSSRSVSRIIAPLMSFNAHKEQFLYRRALELPWEELLTEGDTIAVFANVSNSNVRNSHYAALLIKDAICDRMKEVTGDRPNVDRNSPTLSVSLFMNKNHATLGIDTSGGPLYRRGYRVRSVTAPMQETVGGIIGLHIAWDGTGELHDLMCGSGTMLLETAMAAYKIPPALLRERFGFESLPEFSRAEFRAIKSEMDDMITPPALSTLHANDISPKAVKACKANSNVLFNSLPKSSATPSQEEGIHFTQLDFRDHPPITNGTILCNPPWGTRLGTEREAKDFLTDLGNFFKRKCTGSVAYIYVGDKELLKSVGLRPTWKRPVVSGNLNGRLARYELY